MDNFMNCYITQAKPRFDKVGKNIKIIILLLYQGVPLYTVCPGSRTFMNALYNAYRKRGCGTRTANRKMSL